MSDYSITARADSSSQLIPVFESRIGGEAAQCVSARELHAFLEVRKQFSDWMQYQLQTLGLEEDIDFLTFTPESEKGRPALEYALTLDAAKHVAMASRTEKGRIVRQFFIEFEKRMRLAAQTPQNLGEALRLAADLYDRNQAQAKLLAEAQPKVEFFDAVAASKDTCDMSEVAKVLAIPDMGRNKLFAFLRERRVLRFNNQPYQEYVDRGYFRTEEQRSLHKDGSARITFKTVVFQKGLDYIRRLLEKRCS